MSSIKQPVVWCSDPNSTNQKPTAFALHGIQFEGNITEQHVSALHEIINAAAEGRLLLPSDGAIVLLDGDVDAANSSIVNNGQQMHQQQQQTHLIEQHQTGGHQEIAKLSQMQTNNKSTVTTLFTSAVQTAESLTLQRNEQTTSETKLFHEFNSCDLNIPNENKNCNLDGKIHGDKAANVECIVHRNGDCENSKLEPKYSTFNAPELGKYDFIYEFLCCAKCINDQNLNNHHHRQHCRNNGDTSTANKENANATTDGTQFSKDAIKKLCRTKRIKQCDHHDELIVNVQTNINNSINKIVNSEKCQMQRSKVRKRSSIEQPMNINAQLMCTLANKLEQNASAVPMYATINNKLRKRNVFAKHLVPAFDSIAHFQHQQPQIELNNVPHENSDDIDNIDGDVKGVNQLEREIEIKCNNSMADSESNEAADPAAIKTFAKNSSGSQTQCAGKNAMDSVMKILPIVEDSQQTNNELQAVAAVVTTTTTKETSVSQKFATTITPTAADQQHSNEGVADTNDTNARPAGSKNSSRKTSLDSSCTIGSMDSGFIEMQNKLESSTKEMLNQITGEQATSSTKAATAVTTLNGQLIPPIIVTDDSTSEIVHSTKIVPNNSIKDGSGLLKECSIQSRNRRKSYEEFKAIYHNRNTIEQPELPFVRENDLQLPVCHQKDKIKSRRKSYEEFKALVREYNDNLTANTNNEPSTKLKHSSKQINAKQQNFALDDGKTDIKTECDDDEKNRKISISEKANNKSISSECNALAKVGTTQPKTKNDIYKTNFKIYDKLISYGTIYDIMQKKTDIYYKAYRKYDAYMTYGTIYEILQRKSDDYDLFRRKRAVSEKFINKRVNCLESSSDKSDSNNAIDDKSQTTNFGTIYDIIQRNQRQSHKSNSLPNNVIGAFKMAKVSSASETEMKKNKKSGFSSSNGCIYDMIQSEVSDLTKSTASIESNEASHNANVINNRFLVEKVNENELTTTSENNKTISSTDSKSNTYSEPVPNSPSFLSKWSNSKSNLHKTRKTNRMRRFSQILSYSHRGSNEALNRSNGNEQMASDTTSMPYTIDENSVSTHVQSNALTPIPINTTSAYHMETDISTLSQLKKLSKMRKMSSPLPLSCSEKPPKIIPRKQSVPPPPLPPAMHLLTQQHHTQPRERLSLSTIFGENNIIDDDMTDNGNKSADCATNQNNENSFKSNSNDTNSNLNKYRLNNFGDNKLIKIKPNKSDTKVAAKKSVTRDKKIKSRRLSELTRGEFLNEKP